VLIIVLILIFCVVSALFIYILDMKYPKKKRIVDRKAVKRYWESGSKCEYPGCHKIRQDPHHIIFKSQGGDDTPENLINLCRNCHDKAHGKVNGVCQHEMRKLLLKIKEGK